MKTKSLCDVWGDLIFGENRGEIYEFFKCERGALINHLKVCGICKRFLLQIQPMPSYAEKLDSLKPQEFADLIRMLYNNAAQMSFEDDDINATD